MAKRRKRGKEAAMATSGTEVGQQYGSGEHYTGLVNIGHGILSVVDDLIVGKLTYPGPGSNGVSSQEGDCSAILAQMPWLAGTPGGTGPYSPAAVQQPAQGGKIIKAGYAITWTMPDGTPAGNPQGAPVWVNTDGTVGPAPASSDPKAAAEKALNDALTEAQAAAAVLASY